MMPNPKTLPAFTPEEKEQAHKLLATTVVFMMGRKFEEGDWSNVYCRAKNIRCAGWSNLNIDVMHEGLGVEHKMLRSSKPSIKDECGERYMHPSATRAIRIAPEGDANEVMRDVLTQYAQLIERRREKVRETKPDVEPDMRTGWLLWQASLKEFLYFEEEMATPNPDDYSAEWRESGGGSRKASKNLWIYDRQTGLKKYSVTTAAGAKIQPYFEIPPPSDPNLYLFRVQGEELIQGYVQLWIAATTARELKRLVEPFTPEKVSEVILEASHEPAVTSQSSFVQLGAAVPIEISAEAYAILNTSFPGVSDEHMIQLLIQYLHEK